MASLPSATVTVSAEAGPSAGGTGYIAVFGCVGTSADITPRVFTSAKSLIAQHGYSQAVDYAALHIEATRKPVLFIGLPVVTAGTATAVVATGAGTSVVTVTPGVAGYLDEVNAVIKVITGGTVGTNGIVISVSMDGGTTEKLVRLGTATTYAVPYLGIVITFGIGTLLAGGKYTFSTTAPMWDSAGLTAARLALAAQQKPTRSWMVVGDIATSTVAGYVTTAVNAYETSNKRFALARVNVRDRLTTETMSAWVSAMDAAFATVDSQKRIDIGLGRLRKLSPITGWELRRPVAWAASIREYQKDIHITTWRVDDGPLDGWSAEDASGNVVEYDERSVGGGLAGRFTVATTLDNGPNGSFIATSLTRDVEGSLLSYTHNMHVANLCCTVVQQVTNRFIGQTPPLNSDGTMRADARSKLESRVNTALARALLSEFVPGEGARASLAVWTMSTSDVLNVVGATVTGAAKLEVNGTIVSVITNVRVS
ncbi:MAG TPA: hypothetical protein VNJ04_05175 [Gemmatimonadaceae bacterium]|nr:hypothetical protein [Gemmatimonadaceae bacterium]